jgi:hypothetical protein
VEAGFHTGYQYFQQGLPRVSRFAVEGSRAHMS